MASHADTLNRQWLMLQCIPRHPAKITARELVERLHAEGFAVTKRTVERDLALLSKPFPLLADERTRPFGWSWHKDAPLFSIPGMSPLQAMVLNLTHNHLRPLLPAHLLDALHPYFQQADAVLEQSADTKAVASWGTRVAMVQPAQPLLAPTVSISILETVHDALTRQRQIEVTYRSRSAQRIMRYRLHPLGLVYRGPVGYLVATSGDHDDPRQFALHRIKTASMLAAAAISPAGFDLAAYAHSGAFGFLDKGPIELALRMRNAAAAHLHETPLSANQHITPDAQKGWVHVRATVNDTSQLRWWLLAFGSQVEVLAPASLRDAFEAQFAANPYVKGTRTEDTNPADVH